MIELFNKFGVRLKNNQLNYIMCDRNSETSQMVKSMVHGKPSRRECAGQSMYDIFNWPQQNPQQNEKNNLNPNNPNLKNNYVLKQCSCQPRNYHEVCKDCLCGQKVYQSAEQNQNLRPHKQIDNQQQERNQYMLIKTKPQLKPRQIKNQLYMYQNVNLKRNLSEEPAKNKSQIKKQGVHAIASTRPKLNEKNDKDRYIIEKRKQKIKQFRQFTRDLPNSAFTTYYGKPAFESYGRCNSSSNLKTHNVMPHKGENRPKTQQTYQGALINAKKVRTQDHLPRKPLQQQNQASRKNKVLERIDVLPIQKPDLINHIRFSQPAAQSDRKQRVPLHTDINYIPKRSQKAKKQKRNKKEKMSTQTDFGDGLKFMNTRDHLISLLEEKKIRDSKLAYKVTECYPQVKNAYENRKTQSDMEYYDRPAGVAYERGEPAQKVIYRRY